MDPPLPWSPPSLTPRAPLHLARVLTLAAEQVIWVGGLGVGDILGLAGQAHALRDLLSREADAMHQTWAGGGLVDR
jgi:hypothetical protein